MPTQLSDSPYVFLKRFQVALLFAVLASHAAAQDRVTVEVRAGSAVPVGSFGGEEGGADGGFGAGPSMGVHLSGALSMHTRLSLGFTQSHFSCASAECAALGGLASTAWQVGTRVQIGTGKVVPWLRLGALLDRSERRGATGETGGRNVSEFALGGEAGVGLSFRYGRATAGPAIRYTRIDVQFPDVVRTNMTYVVADFGVSIAF